MKKTYISLEPGENHPALCILIKYLELEGHLNTKAVMKYKIQSLEALPKDLSNIDLRGKIESCLKRHTMGDIRIILGYTYITEDMKRFFEKTSLKPVKIRVTGDKESYRDGMIINVPYSEILGRIDELQEQERLLTNVETAESGFIEDDDCDLALGMAVWFAAQDAEQDRGKNIPGFI